MKKYKDFINEEFAVSDEKIAQREKRREAQNEYRLNKKTRKFVTIMIKGEIIEAFTSLKDACVAHGFMYNTLRIKNFPFVHDGWYITKIVFNKKHDEVEKKEPPKFQPFTD